MGTLVHFWSVRLTHSCRGTSSTTESTRVLHTWSETVVHFWSKVTEVTGFWTVLQTERGSSQHSWDRTVEKETGGMPARAVRDIATKLSSKNTCITKI